MNKELMPHKYLQVAGLIEKYIRSNRLLPGSKLPGGRKLAEILCVSKNTVYEALELLQSNSKIEIIKDSGSYVSKEAWFGGETNSPDWEKYVRLGYQRPVRSSFKHLCHKVSGRDTIYLSLTSFADEFGWNEVLSEAIGSLVNDAVTVSSLGSYDVRGPYSLRREVASYLKHKGIVVLPDEIILAPSVSIAFDIVSRGLFSSGSTLYLPESSGANGIVGLKSLGVDVVCVPEDGDGIMVDMLENIGTSYKRSAVIAAPSSESLKCRTMSAARRRKLLNLCVSQKMPLIECDVMSDFYPESPLSIKAIDKNDCVIYMGSLPQQCLFGVNTAWIVANEYLADRFSEVAANIYHYPFNINYAVIEKLLASGAYYRFIKNFLTDMERRIAVTNDLLDEYLYKYARWNRKPRYGMFELDFGNETIVKRMFYSDSPVVFLTDIRLDSSDKSSIYIAPLGIPENKLREGIKILGSLAAECSI